MKTVLIRVTEELRAILDKGERVALVLLDLSAAFDIFSNGLLVDTLVGIWISGTAKELFSSFLRSQEQFIHLGEFESNVYSLPGVVPQGSSLSPILFNIYPTPLADLVRSFGLSLTSHMDDTQLEVKVDYENSRSTANVSIFMRQSAPGCPGTAWN